MQIVSPPFVLDFVAASLDQPVFAPDELQDWYAEKEEQFDDKWPEVRKLLAAFRRHGIYLSDVKPGNITF